MLKIRYTSFALSILISIMLIGAFVLPVSAEPSPKINYQGKLTLPTGQAVADSDYYMRFYLYNAVGGATTTAIWTEVHTGGDAIPVVNGLFSVMLGSTTPLTGVDFNQTLYLGIEIGGTALLPAWDGEMSPRKELGTIPSAFEAYKVGGVSSSSLLRSDQADTMSANTASTLLTLIQSGVGDILNIFDGSTEVFTVLDGGNVGIGSSTPNSKLTVGGFINVDDTSSGLGGIKLNGVSLATGSTTLNNFFFANASSTTFTSDSYNNYAIGDDALSYLTTGGSNFAVGAGALRGSTTAGMSGGGNNALGSGTLASNSTGEANNALGSDALNYNTTGSNNNALGVFALLYNTTGSYNNALGYRALALNSTGSNNNAFGQDALYNGSRSHYNNAIGAFALRTSIIGSYNNAFGYETLYSNTTGSYNNVFGYQALDSNNGTGTIAIGYRTAENAISVDRGIFIGYDIDAFSTTADDVLNIGNLIFGTGVDGTGTTYSSGNVGIGTASPNAKLDVSKSGISNGNYLFNFGTGVDVFTAWKENIENDLIHYGFGSSTPNSFVSIVGPDQQDVTSGDDSVDVLTVIGGKADSGFGVLPAGNGGGIIMTAGDGGDDIGAGGGLGGNITLNPGAGDGAAGNIILANLQGNVGIGTASPNAKLTVAGFINVDDTNSNLGGLKLNDIPLVTGSTTLNNFFFANASSTTFTSGATHNYAIGDGALKNLTTGENNFSVGWDALTYNTTGSENNALGSGALSYNTTGSHNIALGASALFSNTIGLGNSAFGSFALSNNATGSYNTALGFDALSGNNGTGTIAIGYGAANNAVSVDRGIFIGYDIDAFSTTADDVLNIGNLIFGNNVDGTGTTYSSGNVGIGTSSPFTKLTVAGGFLATGGIYDNNYTRGTIGQILQTTGTGVTWVSTSTLGIYSNPFGSTIDPTELTATDFGSFTCNGTTCSVDTGAITSTMLLDDTIDFADISYANTLASNPAFGTGESFFGSTGILFEGTTADGFETLLTAADPTADRTLTLPNQTGTIAITTSAMTGTFDGNNFASGAITTGALLYGSGAGSISNLTVGTTGQILQVSGGVPTWQSTSSLNIINNDTVITVAASDTPSAQKANADYIADGTDDEVQIQAALDSLPATGGTVELLSGTFNVGTTTYATAAINITRAGTTLIGQGTSTLISLNTGLTGEANAILTAVKATTISSLRIDANDAGSTGAQRGITSSFSSLLVVDSVVVQEAEIGVFLVASSYNTVRNSIFSSNETGVLATLGSQFTTVHNNSFVENTFAVGTFDFFGKPTDTSITDNIFVNNGGGATSTLLLGGTSRVLVADNTFTATGTAAFIRIEADSTSVTISNNTYNNPTATSHVSDAGINTRYNQLDRRTLTTETSQGYNLFSIIGSTTATSAAITQLGTGDIFTLNNASGRALTVFNSGNMSIGTTTEYAPLTIAGGGEETFMGTYKDFVSTNSTLDAYQFGDATTILMNNSTTTNMFGSYITIQDNSDDPNLVFGLNVGTELGSNNAGLNIGVFASGKTYGVSGKTTAGANGIAEGAGGFFETEGTTQGNAIRGYSDSITTATLLSLFQETSTFAGTGLKMNFGNNSGSFTATTSKYLDFQNAGVSVFTVSARGTTTIGTVGATTHLAGLLIGYGGICIDDDGTCTVSTPGQINSVSQSTGHSDVAEMYFSSTELEPGEIVTLSGGLSIDRASMDSETSIIGVVSTNPGLTLGFDDVSLVESEKGYPVALSGRVPIKLSNENGPIKKGDALMLSNLPGIAMKAKGTGMVIGTALEDFDDTRMYSETFINQFGDSLIEPVYDPVFTDTDPRINDGCYYGSGLNPDGSLCVPLVATTTEGQIDEVNEILEGESVAEALQELREERSEVKSLNDGTEVKVGQIVMFVDLSKRWINESQLASIGILFGTSSIEQVGDIEEETIFDRLVKLANSFVDGVLSIFEIRVNRIEVENELCVDGVCIHADDLRNLLDSQNSTNQSPVYDSQDSNDETPEEPIVEVPVDNTPDPITDESIDQDPQIDDNVADEVPSEVEPVIEEIVEDNTEADPPPEVDEAEGNSTPEPTGQEVEIVA